jgi:hypothetical protein
LQQTGTSDIPLTAEGVETMKRTASIAVPGMFDLIYHLCGVAPSLMIGLPDVINPKNVAHVFVSPRQRAQKTAELVRVLYVLGFEGSLIRWLPYCSSFRHLPPICPSSRPIPASPNGITALTKDSRLMRSSRGRLTGGSGPTDVLPARRKVDPRERA